MSGKEINDAPRLLAKVLRVMVWIVAVSALIVGFFLFATDRLLLAAAVVLSMGVLAMALLGFAQIAHPFQYKEPTDEGMRRATLLVLAVGCGVVATGALLTWVWPGALANFLLVWFGPPIVLGSITLLLIFRPKKESQHPSTH